MRAAPFPRKASKPARVRCACPACSFPVLPRAPGRYSCPQCGVQLEVWITKAALHDLVPSAAPAGPAAATAETAACVVHPQNASAVACSRCGDFICEVCRIKIEGKDLCPACFERGIDNAELATVKRQFRTPDFAMGIGIASIPGGCVISFFSLAVGIFAVALGIQALLKISKQPSLGGKSKAIIGIVCGTIGFLLWTGLLVSGISDVLDASRYED
jgi:hypothetical protein